MAYQSATDQPSWKYLTNLGDVHYLDYGGYFVFQDATGVYAPEAELLLEPCEGDPLYTIYRFELEPCTFVNRILSDNPFHPDMPAWFAKPESKRKDRPQDTTYLSNVARANDISRRELVSLFLSTNPIDRAHAWRYVGEYHGFENLDSYPLRLTRAEAKDRYTRLLGGE